MRSLSNEFYCLAIDLPGHGKTEVVGGDQAYSITVTANGIIQFLNALSIQKCGLVGYSMGGRLALYLSIYFPETFCKTVLESASPGLKTQAEREQRAQRDRVLADQLEANFSRFIKEWYDQPLFASLQQHPRFQSMRDRRLKNNPVGLARSLRYLSTGCQPSLWHELQNSSVSLLLLAGELDQKFLGLNTEILSLCNLAQLEIIKNCGHNIHLEQATLFTEKIRAFLMQHEPLKHSS